MKIFVAGATGVLGRRAVAQLVEAGHEVTGVARSEEKAELVRSLGATPVTVDLFDPAAVKDAVDGHDVVMNLATHIPPLLEGRAARARGPRTTASGPRRRSNLVDAALATGASRYVQESIAFMYADSGDRVDRRGHARSTRPASAVRCSTPRPRSGGSPTAGGTGVVLRFGQFYAPEASHTIAMVKAASAGIAPAARAQGRLRVDDRTPTTRRSAVVAALQAPAGTYNVTDDEPVTRDGVRRDRGRRHGRRSGPARSRPRWPR